MKEKKKEMLGFIVFCLIVLLLVLSNIIPSKLREKRASEEYRYLREEIQETGETLKELEQKSKEVKETLLKELESLE